MRNRNFTESGLCSWALHFTPQLWPQMEFLCLVHEVSTWKTAPNERLETCYEVKPSLITMETVTAIPRNGWFRLHHFSPSLPRFVRRRQICDSFRLRRSKTPRRKFGMPEIWGNRMTHPSTWRESREQLVLTGSVY